MSRAQLGIVIGATAVLAFGVEIISVERPTAARGSGVAVSQTALAGRLEVLSVLAEAVGARDAGLSSTIPYPYATDSARVARTIAYEQLAARDLQGRKLPAPSATPIDEIMRALQESVAHRVRYVTTSRTLASSGLSPALTPSQVELLSEALRVGAPGKDLVTEFESVGWIVSSGDAAVSDAGPAYGWSPEFLAAIRAASPRTVVGPVVGPDGEESMAYVMAVPEQAVDAAAIEQEMVARAGKDALQSWAQGRATIRALRIALLAEWSSETCTERLTKELVIDPDPGSVQRRWQVVIPLLVSEITPPGVSPADMSTQIAQLVADLKAKDPAARQAQFADLVATARAQAGNAAASGVDQLVPDDASTALGTAMSSTKVTAGSVVGPVDGPVGDALYLTGASYDGPLGSTGPAVFAQAAVPDADFAAVAALHGLRAGPRTTTGIWESSCAWLPHDPETALFSSPTGELVGPYLESGEVLVARPSVTRTGPISQSALAQLELDGVDRYLASQAIDAGLTLDPALGSSATAAASRAPAGIEFLTPAVSDTP